ncbi:PAQR family membrane homeostasis protein TrhA [Leifsonia sp. Leaf264]|uniref:PAQR family membrane homeostasis protein TrhA n=1 Tax=Leifsonia sp. Leaf264 TaxID=1736314 RepID=UPI0009E94FD3|nr:hemolysin III family protein [Leifsonia sp. Leaf264]
MSAVDPREPQDVREHLDEPRAELSGSDAAVATDEDLGPDLPNIPFLDASPANPDDVKPTWRGWIHAGTFPLALVLGIVLICLADGPWAQWSSAVFVLTSLLLFGNSALYHRFDWQPRTKVILKRIDHANIFLLIAGTYTPLAVLALPPEKGWLLLALVWTGALLGIGFRVFWIGAPRWLYVPIYIALGWAAMMYIVDLLNANVAMMVLVVIGGLLYTGGAIVYALKKPNPWPGRFGFHEIFHTCTLFAFLCHWTAVLLIALAPAYHAG